MTLRTILPAFATVLLALPFASGEISLDPLTEPLTPEQIEALLDAPRTHCRLLLGEDETVTDLGCFDFTLRGLAAALNADSQASDAEVPAIPLGVGLDSLCSGSIDVPIDITILPGFDVLEAQAACASPGNSGVVVATLYEHIRYNNDPNNPGGRSISFGTASGKCVRGAKYGVSDLGAYGWSNIVSSAKTHESGSGCSNGQFFDGTGYTGDFIVCCPSCYDMVSYGFNDRASSARFYLP